MKNGKTKIKQFAAIVSLKHTHKKSKTGVNLWTLCINIDTGTKKTLNKHVIIRQEYILKK